MYSTNSGMIKTKIGMMLPATKISRDVKAGDTIYYESNNYYVKGKTYPGGKCVLILTPCK